MLDRLRARAGLVRRPVQLDADGKAMPPHSPPGQVIDYARSQWTALRSAVLAELEERINGAAETRVTHLGRAIA